MNTRFRIKRAVVPGVLAGGMLWSSVSWAAHAGGAPIHLRLGGYSTWWFGVASQSSSFKKARDADFSSTDVKGDNKMFVEGDTQLDNGMRVGFVAEFDGGGGSNTKATSEAAGGDYVERSYVYAEGRLGRLVVGAQDNGAYLMHVSAPDAAANSEDAKTSLLSGNWVVVPSSVSYLETTAIDTTGTAEKVIYFTPNWEGLRLSATFVPGAGEYSYTQTKIEFRRNDRDGGRANEVYSLGIGYSGTVLGGVGIRLSAGWMNGSSLQGISSYNDYSAGAQVAYGGFTVGGAYRLYEQKVLNGARGPLDGRAWTMGVQYAIGPAAVSLGYFDSRTHGTGTGENDKVRNVNLSGKFTMGRGVDFLASVGYIRFDAGTSVSIDKNEGWAGMTGLALTF